jgi:hypothetical protein
MRQRDEREGEGYLADHSLCGIDLHLDGALLLAINAEGHIGQVQLGVVVVLNLKGKKEAMNMRDSCKQTRRNI